MDHFTEDDGPQLNLPIRFRTRSIDGRLITLSAQGLEGTIFTVIKTIITVSLPYHYILQCDDTLSAYVDNAAVAVDLIDSQGKLMRKIRKQLPGVNNGIEHSMSIQLNLERKILKLIYGEGMMDTYEFNDNVKVENRMQLEIIIGNNGSLFSTFRFV
uniref:Bm10186 n=1 Tax=Brugia malayi TaxID=6279 RepID=A0A1I9GDB4_BRUMA|nr:Bm10186 [Brugia malayi]